MGLGLSLGLKLGGGGLGDPSLGMDFVADADGRYTLNGTVYNNLPSFLTATGGTFSRASIGTYFDSTGTLQTASSGTPRFDHDPVTHAPKGILIEEARTNLLPQSTLDTNWVAAGTTPPTVLHSQTIDGIPCAAITFTSGMTTGYAGSRAGRTAGSNAPITSGQTYTTSIWIRLSRALTGSEAIDVYYTGVNALPGLSVSSSSTAYFNTWSRMVMPSGLVGFSGVDYPVVFLSGSLLSDLTVYVARGQLEQGSFATSYIPTTTTAVTRNLDLLTVPTSTWLNAPAGSFAFRGYVGTPIFAGTLFAVSAGTSYKAGNGYLVRYGGGNPQAGGEAGISAIAIPAGFAINTPFRVSASYSGTTHRIASSTLISSNTNNDFTGVGTTTLLLGSIRTDGLQSIGSGHVSSIKYYPLALSNIQLQLLAQ